MLAEIAREIAQTGDRQTVWQALLRLTTAVAILRIRQQKDGPSAELWVANGTSVVAASSNLSGKTETGYAALAEVLALKKARYELQEASGQLPREKMHVFLSDLALDEVAAAAWIKAVGENRSAASQSSAAAVGSAVDTDLPQDQTTTSTHANLRAYRRWQDTGAVSDKTPGGLPPDGSQATKEAQAATRMHLKQKVLPVEATFALKLLTAGAVAVVVLGAGCVGFYVLFDSAAAQLCSRQVNMAINRGAEPGLGIPNIEDETSGDDHLWPFRLNWSEESRSASGTRAARTFKSRP